MSDQFNFREHCFLCRCEITEELVPCGSKKEKARKKGQCNEENIYLIATILKAAENPM